MFEIFMAFWKSMTTDSKVFKTEQEAKVTNEIDELIASGDKEFVPSTED